MKTFISALAFGSAFVAANLIQSSAKLSARQDLDNPTFPRECDAECVGFAKFFSGCPGTKMDLNASGGFECICTPVFFEDIQKCGTCAPSVFTNLTTSPGLDGYIQVGQAKCQENGFPVAVVHTTSSALPTTSGTVSGTGARTTSLPPTPKGSDTTLGRLTGAPVSTSPAPAQPTGAASRSQFASGLFAMAFTAWLYTLL